MAQTQFSTHESPDCLRIIERSSRGRDIDSLMNEFGITSREAWKIYKHLDQDIAAVRAYLRNREP